MKFIILIMSLLLVLGCTEIVEPVVVAEDVPNEQSEQVREQETEEVVEEEPVVEEEQAIEEIDLGCVDSEECGYGEYCINEGCKKIADIYSDDCTNKCKLKEVILSTSDGEDYTLVPGKGSYSYAGAITWKLMVIPDYCPEDELSIPIKIEKINYGKLLGSEVFTIKEGEVSKVITHPTVTRAKFTVELKEIKQEC